MDSKTSTALTTFVATAQTVVNEHYARSFPTLTPSVLTVEAGRRYVRVVTTTDGGRGQRSVYCFVDTTNGNVLKAETWKKPAKHARANIFNADHGRSGIDWHGGVYIG